MKKHVFRVSDRILIRKKKKKKKRKKRCAAKTKWLINFFTVDLTEAMFSDTCICKIRLSYDSAHDYTKIIYEFLRHKLS